MSTTEEVKKKAPAKPRAKKVAKDAEEAVVTAEVATEVVSKHVGDFITALGRRKTAIARVKLTKNGSGKITINGRPFEDYFTTFEMRSAVKSALSTAGQETAVDVDAAVKGGGVHAQSEAVRLGISRALIELNQTYRKTLKKMGFLTRDPRAKERKKPGLKRARRSPQWSKR